jgi:queuine tRNA-ribosyltransferase
VNLRQQVEAVDGAARATRITTARGSFSTPCFMPVGTRAAVRTLSSDDLARIGVQVALANTYHLMLRPGTDVVAGAGGLHSFWAWDGHLLTDSGGYQVFSLSPDVDDDGVTFRSVYDGSTHRLTPEGAVAAQEALGADIQMALDVCPPLPSPPEVVRSAVERTLAWARRARAAHRREGQSLFGIVQGGIDEALRTESARRTVELDFHGYGIGGLSVGEGRPEMLAALAAVTPGLPADRPRYLMGVGDPVGLLEAGAAHPPGAARHDPDQRRQAQHRQRRTCAQRPTARRRMPLRRVRHVVARLPTAPAQRRGAWRGASSDAAQPVVGPRPAGKSARRHPRGAARTFEGRSGGRLGRLSPR